MVHKIFFPITQMIYDWSLYQIWPMYWLSNLPRHKKCTRDTSQSYAWIKEPLYFFFVHHSDFTWVSWCLSQPATLLFVQQHIQSYKENIKASHYWSFARGIHQRPVNSFHKRPVRGKAFSWHVFFMTVLLSTWVVSVMSRIACYVLPVFLRSSESSL